MINGKNQYDARTKEYNKLINCFVDELLATVRLPKSKQTHIKTYSSLYELMKNSALRGEVESCRSLVIKIQSGNYTEDQRSIAAKRLREKIVYISTECLLKVKQIRRLQVNNFAKMIKAIIVEQNLFDKYIHYSDLSISNYYDAQQTALKNNPRNTITYDPDGSGPKTSPTF